MPYRNGTKQEKLVQRCIEELGLRYVEQAKFGQYEVDFLLTELDVVVEADGPFGHLAKRDARRDKELIDMGVAEVWHLKEKTLQDIKERLWQELNRYQNQIV